MFVCVYVLLCASALGGQKGASVSVPGVRVTQHDVLGTELQYPGRDKDFFLV